MKGNNTITINAATMQVAVQEWLEKRWRSSSGEQIPRVTSIMPVDMMGGICRREGRDQVKRERPAFNHTREDSFSRPCVECLFLMRRRELRDLVRGLLAEIRELEARGCPVHVREHGREAEELRTGIEKLIASTSPGRLPSALESLLDSVDARDSLAYLERKDRAP